MATQIKPGLKWFLIGLGAVVIFGGLKWYQSKPKVVNAVTEVGQVAIPTAPEASLPSGSAVKLPFPSNDPALNGGLKIDMYQMPWMAQSALNYANGGTRTTKGSLMDKAGIDMNIITQLDDGKSRDLMVAWAKDYHDGKTKDGFIIADMGSQMDSYIGAMDSILKPYGAEYQIAMFGVIGFSRGEDQWIGPIEYKNNPQSARGAVVRGVRLGGDLDIVIKWAGDNNIHVNQNEKLYYPDMINLSYGADFISVVNDYNAMQSEKRRIVRDGKTAGDTTVIISSVATWTPGDINAIVGGGAGAPRGGATIISTGQYKSMMPCLLLTCRKFLSDNNTKIQSFLSAAFQGGDQVRTFTEAKEYALGLDATIWNERDKAFWVKYYGGVQQGDAHLGGSMVCNLADAANLFGLKGTTDIYREVYNTFLGVHKKLYGSELNSAPLYQDVMDKSYMAAVISNRDDLLKGKANVTQYADQMTTKFASKNVQINFATGSAIISPSSYSTLNGIYSDLITGDGLKVGVFGYTDNTGNPDKNQTLSEARAESVKQYFIKKGLDPVRVESKGYGDQNPVADNNTAAGKAANRRVEIALGQ